MDKAISVFAPFECLNCGVEGPIICPDCQKTLAISKRSSCFRCNKLTLGWRACSNCRRQTKVNGVIIASHYKGLIKQVIKQLKYERAISAAKVLAGILADNLDPSQYDLVTWVPSSSRRQRQRGYNPAEVISRELAQRVKIPCYRTLGKLGDVRQVGATRQQRLTQLKDSIYPVGKSLTEKRVLLVDDILTTGATITECTTVLKAGGAKSVWGIVVAKH